MNNTQVKLCKSEGIRTTYDWYNSFTVAICLVVLLLTFCFRLVNVQGNSMEQTLYDSDKVLVSNLFYTPKTGDVIIISHGEIYTEPLIKRVIATEGQSLKIDFETETIMVDGVVIDEPYKYTSMDAERVTTKIPEVVPEGKIFVLGDHRAVSLDSRSQEVGLIDEKDVLGKAYYILFPFERFANIS